MNSTARTGTSPVPAVQRYFEVSLYLLASTGVLAVVLTGKIDPVSTILAPVAVVYKGTRIWRKRGPEISVRLATWLVLAVCGGMTLALGITPSVFVHWARDATLIGAHALGGVLSSGIL